MPKRVQPKYGYEPKYLLSPPDRTYFTRPQAEELARTHDIENVDELEDWLNGVAHIYALHKLNFDDRPRPKHIRAALAEIYDLATELENRLARLDDSSRRFLWRPQMEVDMQAIKGQAKSEFGHRFTRWPSADGSEEISYLDPSDIVEGVTILTNFAAAALEDIPEGKRGARRNHGLRIWMSNAYSFWTEKLGRRFTSNPHKGEGTTPAYDFCRDCLAVFAPELTTANIITGMRRVIERKREKLRRS